MKECHHFQCYIYFYERLETHVLIHRIILCVDPLNNIPIKYIKVCGSDETDCGKSSKGD